MLESYRRHPLQAKFACREYAPVSGDHLQVPINQDRDVESESFDTARDLANQAQNKAGDLASQAQDKAANLANQAQDTAGKIGDQASDWVRRYRGWPALAKLEYVDRAARELSDQPPRRALEVAVRELPVEEMKSTLEQFYRERQVDEDAALHDLLPDARLEDIFVHAGGAQTRPAAAFLHDYRKIIVDKITYWTGVRRSLVKKLVELIGRRARELELCVERDREPLYLVEVVAFATTLAMNYLTRGRFAER